MVKITNGVNVYEVTIGAYNDIYRHQGYQVINKKKEQDFGVEPSEVNNKTADEIFIDELQEKPISQWNKDEVKRYAAIKEIDLTGTKNVNDAKEIIKKILNKKTGEEEE